MWVVELDTSSFSFRAFGETEAHARLALAAGWKKHVRQTGADPGRVDPATEGDAYEARMGECRRDDHVLATVPAMGRRASQ